MLSENLSSQRLMLYENVIREFSPNSKSISENSVQAVLLEHLVRTVLNVIRANRKLKPKNDLLLSGNSVQTVVAHNLSKLFSQNST